FGQHRGLAVVDVAGRREQGERPVCGDAAQPVQGLPGVGVVEFGAIATPELGELARVVPEPLAKLGRRGDVLEPLVHVQVVLANTARPYAVDQHAGAVLAVGFVIDTADPDRALSHRRHLRRASALPPLSALGWERSTLPGYSSQGVAGVSASASARGAAAATSGTGRFRGQPLLAAGDWTGQSGPLAQSAEQRTFNPRVRGSIPRGPTRLTSVDFPSRSPRRDGVAWFVA